MAWTATNLKLCVVFCNESEGVRDFSKEMFEKTAHTLGFIAAEAGIIKNYTDADLLQRSPES